MIHHIINLIFYSPDIIDLSNIEDLDNSDDDTGPAFPSLVKVRVKLEKIAYIPKKRKNSNNTSGGHGMVLTPKSPLLCGI